MIAFFGDLISINIFNQMKGFTLQVSYSVDV